VVASRLVIFGYYNLLFEFRSFITCSFVFTCEEPDTILMRTESKTQQDATSWA